MKRLFFLFVITALSMFAQGTKLDWSAIKNIPPNLSQACPDGMAWTRSAGTWVCMLVGGGGGGSANWGSIGGVLSAQADLQTALNAKLNSVSWGQILGTLSLQNDLQNAFNAKQSINAPGSNGNLIFNSGGFFSGRALINSDLPTSPVTPGSCGDTTHTCSATVNAQGVVTALSNNSISAATLPGQLGTDFQITVTQTGAVANDSVVIAPGRYMLGINNYVQANTCTFKLTAGNTSGAIDLWLTNGGIITGQWTNSGTNALSVTGTNCAQSGAATPAFPQCDGSHMIGSVNMTNAAAFDPASINQSASLQMPCQLVAATGLSSSVIGNTQTIGPAAQLLRLDVPNATAGPAFSLNLSAATSFGPYPTVNYATLSGLSVVASQQFYCSNCTVTSSSDDTCATGGTGADAVGLNGAWHCGGPNQSYPGTIMNNYCLGTVGAAATNFFLTSSACNNTTVLGNPVGRPGLLKNLVVMVATPPTTTLTATVWRTGAPTAITCSMTGPTTTCSDPSHTVALNATDTWIVAINSATGSDAANVRAGVLFQ